MKATEPLRKDFIPALDTVLGNKRKEGIVRTALRRGAIYSASGLTSIIYDCSSGLKRNDQVLAAELLGRSVSPRLLVKEDDEVKLRRQISMYVKAGIYQFAPAMSSMVTLRMKVPRPILDRYHNRTALVMEQIQGISPVSPKDKIQTLTFEDVARIAYQFAVVHDAMHYHGVVSREIKTWFYLENEAPRRIVAVDFDYLNELPLSGVDRARKIVEDIDSYQEFVGFGTNKTALPPEAIVWLKQLQANCRNGEYRSFSAITQFIDSRFDGKFSREYQQILGFKDLPTAQHQISSADWEILGKELNEKRTREAERETERRIFYALLDVDTYTETELPSANTMAFMLFTYLKDYGISTRKELTRRMKKIANGGDEDIRRALKRRRTDRGSIFDDMLYKLEKYGKIKN